MKRLAWTPTLVLVAMVLFAGCQANAPKRVDADDVNREVSEAVDTTAQYASEEASEFVAQSKRKIAQLENQAEAWKARSRDLGAEARAASRKELAELEARAAEARKHLEKFKGDSKMAWAEFRRGAESALTELQEAYDRAAARFSDDG